MNLARSLRERIFISFSDEELRDLCFDYFRSVAEQYTTGMVKSQMVRLLLEYCARMAQGSLLLDVIEQQRPGLIGADRATLLSQLMGASVLDPLSDSTPYQGDTLHSNKLHVNPILSTYVDIELFFGLLSNPIQYAVILKGPHGDAQGIVTLPAQNSTLLGELERIASLDITAEQLAVLGQTLFDILFQGSLREVYRGLQGALHLGQRLRLILHMPPHDTRLSAIPW